MRVCGSWTADVVHTLTTARDWALTGVEHIEQKARYRVLFRGEGGNSVLMRLADGLPVKPHADRSPPAPDLSYVSGVHAFGVDFIPAQMRVGEFVATRVVPDVKGVDGDEGGEREETGYQDTLLRGE